MSKAHTYFPAIDGLRAIAVISVVLYHLNARLLPGGFVGVDVFFVISGFVVSLSMATVRVGGLGSFTTFFYARRLLRIAPALVVCLLVTTLLCCLFIPRGWLSDANSHTGVAAFLGFSNFVLVGQQANGYFEPRAEFNPFTHTWSLAVEEQFYLVFPLLMYLFTRESASGDDRKRSAWALASLASASLACCAWWTRSQPSLAFYLIPARFWELACGVGLFMSWKAWHPRVVAVNTSTARYAGYALLAFLVLSLVAARETAFPFPWAIAPVLCTAGLLALAVSRDDAALPGWLTASPVVGIGKISYSLYLWHWPVLVLFRWTVGLDTFLLKCIALVLSFALAALSYRFVELPLRYAAKIRQAPRWRLVAGSLASVVLATGIAAVMFLNQRSMSLSVTSDWPTWWADNAGRPNGMVAECRVESGQRLLEGGTVLTFHPVECTAERAKSRLYVIGDSHAWAYSGMLRLYAQQSGHEVHLVTKGGCSFFDLQQPMASATVACKAFTEAALKDLSRQMVAGDVLFLPSLRVPRFSDQWGGTTPRPSTAYDSSSRSTATLEAEGVLEPLAGTGVKVVFEAPLPIFKAPPYRCADWFNARNPVCSAGFGIGRDDMEAIRKPALASMREIAIRVRAVSVWDPLPTLCPAPTCQAFMQGKPLFFDGDHLSGLGNSLLVESFAKHMRELEADSAPGKGSL